MAENFTVRKGKKGELYHHRSSCCQWVSLYFSVILGGEDGVAVNVLQSEHNCVGSQPVSRPIESRQSWIQRVIGDALLVSKAATTGDASAQFSTQYVSVTSLVICLHHYLYASAHG